MINPMQLFGMMMNGKTNPQQAVMSMLGKNNSIANNLVTMINNKDQKGLENFARNLCKSKGMNYDTEFANFKSKFGGK